jgi:hypothetical protein
MNANHQKLAEKLTILNERGIGMLTRIYNIKKVCIVFYFNVFTLTDADHVRLLTHSHQFARHVLTSNPNPHSCRTRLWNLQLDMSSKSSLSWTASPAPPHWEQCIASKATL